MTWKHPSPWPRVSYDEAEPTHLTGKYIIPSSTVRSAP